MTFAGAFASALENPCLRRRIETERQQIYPRMGADRADEAPAARAVVVSLIP